MTPLATAFRDQARNCVNLGSPFMGQLCTLLSDRLVRGNPVADRLLDWQGDLGSAGQSVPLRICAALHALKLMGHESLAAVYPPNKCSGDQLWSAVDNAMKADATFIEAWLNSPPQTNEVRRAAALIASGHWLAQRHPLPFVLSELGASGGLNLNWDRFALDIDKARFGAHDPTLVLRPEWQGQHPPRTQITIARRRGVDLQPIDPQSAEGKLRLMAYLWPDQQHRLELTQAAIEIADTPVDQMDAVAWLKNNAGPIEGHVHIIYSTVAWQYLPAAAQAEGCAIIEQAGASAKEDAVVAWLKMETDGHSPGAALTVRLWPGNIAISLGRVDYHGRWMQWTAP